MEEEGKGQGSEGGHAITPYLERPRHLTASPTRPIPPPKPALHTLQLGCTSPPWPRACSTLQRTSLPPLPNPNRRPAERPTLRPSALSSPFHFLSRLLLPPEEPILPVPVRYPTNVPIPTALLAWHQDTGLLSSARWSAATLSPACASCARVVSESAYYVCVLRCVALRDATLCHVTQHGRRGHLPTLSHAVPVNHVLTGPGGSMSVAAASVRTPTTACSQSAQAVHPSINHPLARHLTCSFVISPLRSREPRRVRKETDTPSGPPHTGAHGRSPPSDNRSDPPAHVPMPISSSPSAHLIYTDGATAIAAAAGWLVGESDARPRHTPALPQFKFKYRRINRPGFRSRWHSKRSSRVQTSPGIVPPRDLSACPVAHSSICKRTAPAPGTRSAGPPNPPSARVQFMRWYEYSTDRPSHRQPAPSRIPGLTRPDPRHVLCGLLRASSGCGLLQGFCGILREREKERGEKEEGSGEDFEFDAPALRPCCPCCPCAQP
ncbi:hypothetical protein HETIRDRAFT_455111 [Heterobasidion irregulare TC 32-1]|uniref:Uncharacterized protein n=1 Tax=Heterobasidion irregulare (strain TC 32-1) TaxID=747525 RepID=W4JSR6_HETIT|nr:uncharacterized protein HETIRDRAFT_455111 [Heterobasidion irregulare TC 32-1]ETW76583.1 hypothetical protein HETIRDRAFT_455111 [Heterobasidion irregulare TC 32-1]